MPVNDTETKHTPQSAYCATCRQHCSCTTYSKRIGSPLNRRPAGLFACTVQPYSVRRHTEILWQFDKLRVQQKCIGKYGTFTYLFVILNKLLLFKAYEENRLQKCVYTKDGEYDKPSVQTQNVVALSPLRSGFQSGTPSLSLLYPKYRLVYKPEQSVCQHPIPCIGQFRTLNTPFIRSYWCILGKSRK